MLVTPDVSYGAASTYPFHLQGKGWDGVFIRVDTLSIPFEMFSSAATAPNLQAFIMLRRINNCRCA